MINKVSVKKIVEFRRLTERRQFTFANSLKVPQKPKSDDSDGGGDYWKRSSSGLSNAFKDNDSLRIKEKIDLVSAAYEVTENEGTKIMYKRNLEILHDYEGFDFSIWRPPGDLTFLSKPKILLNIKEIPVQIIPHHVFAYDNNGEPTVGGITFVVWLDGFKQDDLGIYSETLFRYLSVLYSKEFKVDPNYCLTVDAASKNIINYSEILTGKIPSMLLPTIDILKKYLS